MIKRQRPNAVRTEEFILIEHLRENAAQPVWVHQRDDSALVDPVMPRPCGVHRMRRQLWHLPDAGPPDVPWLRAPVRAAIFPRPTSRTTAATRPSNALSGASRSHLETAARHNRSRPLRPTFLRARPG